MTAPPPLRPQRPHIAIIGGGITGLSLALGLLSRGTPVRIYEAAPAFGEIGAGVALGPNALRAMTLISPALKAAHDAIATQSKGTTYFDYRMGMAGAQEGCWIQTTPRGAGGPTTVHRAALLEGMTGLLPEGVAVFGKRVVGVEEVDGGDVRMRFEDGSSAVADAVVGCDGIRSRCRRLVLGEGDPTARALFSGKYAYRGLIPMEEAVAALGDEYARNNQVYCGRDGHVLTFPVQKGKVLNVVAFRTKADGLWEGDDWVVPASKEAIERDFAGWGRAVQSIIGLMRKTDAWALFHHMPARTYCRGRLCLAGDAAHASTPHLGSGAGMGIEDAWLLSELLGSVQSPDEVEAVFKAYDYVRRPRTQKLVYRSVEAAEIVEFQATGIWDDFQKIAKAMDGRANWIWEQDFFLELAKAKEILKQCRGES